MMRLSSTVREFVRADPWLYSIWLKSKRIKKSLPSGRERILVDGFQRSGNTFLSKVLIELLPDNAVCSHFHAIAALRKAQQVGMPSFVLIRDPAASIRSSVAKRIQEFGSCEKRAVLWDLAGYHSYYLYCEKHMEGIFIINFEALINDPARVVAKIFEIADLGRISDDEIKYAINKAEQELRSDTRPGAVKNFPSAEKERAKHLYNYVLDLSEFANCERIYSSLLKKAVIA